MTISLLRTHAGRGFLLCLASTLGIAALYVLGALDGWEYKTIDYRFHCRGNRPVDPSIAVITIDEESIAALGRWPWPRERHGRLIRRLAAAGARVIAFDVLFTEADKDRPSSDALLATAARESTRVVSAFFFNHPISTDQASDPLRPFPSLAAASTLGFVNLDPDSDGVTRRASLYLAESSSGGTAVVHPSLAAAAWAVGTGANISDALRRLQNSIRSSSDAPNQLLINFAYDAASPTGYAYPVYSYAAVLDGRVPASAFAGKFVFVGGTAAALFDVKAVPFVSIHPGVMVHANVLDNLLTRHYLRSVPVDGTILWFLIVGIFLGVVLPRVSPWMKTAVFAAVSGGGLAASLIAFSHGNWVIPVVAPLLTSVACYGATVFYRLVVEEREKRKIKGSFKQYLSPKIIEVITRDPSKLKLGGEEREVSIFFLDIAGFTRMSESLTPTQLVEVMNHCLTQFSQAILRQDGLINKYIGDCVMAFWNAPADQPQHATLACLAALDCIDLLPAINRHLSSRGLPGVDCRIGVNTGTVVVGNMGSDEKFDYTVMGDPVNVASRLESANKQYHSRIMVSEMTFEKAKDAVEARELDLLRVQGRREPLRVFELLSRRGSLSSEWMQARTIFNEGLAFYRGRSFSEAIDAFERVLRFLPDDYVTRLYLERTRALAINLPPDGWDAVHDMRSK